MQKPTQKCYRCDAEPTTREHVPPKAFFPKGANLQLKTLPSCALHNNDKSGDDQYILAHICMHAGAGDNLPKSVFMRSIAPFLDKSSRFHSSLAEGSVIQDDLKVRYPVDLARFDNFFDHLAWAIYFDRYGVSFDESRHEISHVYLSLVTEDPDELSRRRLLTMMLGSFFSDFREMVSEYTADKVNELVYSNKIIDPLGTEASITIAHSFYGVFEVVTLLSRKW